MVASEVAFAEISSTYGHTCAMSLTGAVYCLGWNVTGQLGDATTDDRNVPTGPVVIP